MSVFRAPLTLLVGVGNHISWTPPSTKPQEKEQSKYSEVEPFFKKAIGPGRMAAIGLAWIGCLCEVIVIVAAHAPTSTWADRILSALIVTGSADRIRLTRLYVLGCILVTLGTLIRMSCYRTLGQMFTFELAIRDQHRLGTTGPYGVVRHPSYTGAILSLTGTILCHMTAGSWVKECGIWNTVTGKAVVGGWIAWMVFGVIKLVSRVGKEDEALRQEFGDEWINWAKRVQYRLIPGLY